METPQSDLDSKKQQEIDNTPEELVKSHILKFMQDQHMQVGHALNPGQLLLKVAKWKTSEQEVAEAVIKQMVSDGILTADYKLTEAGYGNLP